MRKLGEKELSLLGDDITEDLLLTHLGEERNIDMLKNLSLINDDREITAQGLKVLSAYPYFGRGEKKRRPYPKMLFSFLLSLSSSLPSPFFDSPFFRKDGFVNLFPTMERSRISRMAYLVGKAMYNRNLFTKDGLVDIKRASAFMALSLHDRMSYILSSIDDRNSIEDISRALHLVGYINGLEKERLERVKKTIKAYSSIDIDMTMLTQIGLIYEEDDLLYSRSLDEGNENEEDVIYTLSSDNTVTYNAETDRDIYLIAEPLSADSNTTQWQITKDSIKKALDCGLSSSEIIRILHAYSSYGVGETVTAQIMNWEREYNQLRVVRGTVVIAEDRYSSLFTLPGIKEHIIEKLGDNSYLFDSASSPDWRSALESYGVSMLGSTKGPEFFFESPSYRIYDTCYELRKLDTIATRREIRFDEKSYTSLLEGATDKWEKLLIASHLVFSRNGVNAYPFVDGLDYNQKKELMHSALKNGEALALEDIDGNYSFLLPLKIEGDTLTTDKGEIQISKIWKVSSAPSYVIREASQLFGESSGS